MMRRFFKRNRRGITLVELIISMSVVAIMMASVGTALPFAVQMYKESAGISTTHNVTSLLQNALRRELLYAENLRLIDSGRVGYDGRLGSTELYIEPEGEYAGLPVLLLTHRVSGEQKIVPLLYREHIGGGRAELNFSLNGDVLTTEIAIRHGEGVTRGRMVFEVLNGTGG